MKENKPAHLKQKMSASAPENANRPAPAQGDTSRSASAPATARKSAPASEKESKSAPRKESKPAHGKEKKPAPMPTPAEVCFSRQERLFQRKSVYALLLKIAIIAGIIALVLQYVFGLAVVQDQTMYPAVSAGDVVMYYRLDKAYAIGDVVTFKKDGIRYFGRIVAMPGDVVDMTDEGELMINGNLQAEIVFYPTYKTEAVISLPYAVMDGEVFLLGDMRTGAIDSRDYGGVSQRSIDGKVFSVMKRRSV